MAFHQEAQARADRLNRAQHWAFCMLIPITPEQELAIAAYNQHVADCQGCHWDVRDGKLVALSCGTGTALNTAINRKHTRGNEWARTPLGLSAEQAGAWQAAQGYLYTKRTG